MSAADAFVKAHVPVVVNKHLEHGESINWLVHWHHMSSIVDSKEVELIVLTHLTSSLATHVPVNVVSISELLLVSPFSIKSPGFASSPVADPVLVSRVDENLYIMVIKNGSDLWHEVGHPVTKKSSVDKLVALDPFAAGCSQGSHRVSIVQESI